MMIVPLEEGGVDDGERKWKLLLVLALRVELGEIFIGDKKS